MTDYDEMSPFTSAEMAAGLVPTETIDALITAYKDRKDT